MSMHQIQKIKLNHGTNFVPPYCKVLSVGVQFDELRCWVLAPIMDYIPDGVKESYTIDVFHTGDYVVRDVDSTQEYQGTFIMQNGNYVAHVFFNNMLKRHL